MQNRRYASAVELVPGVSAPRKLRSGSDKPKSSQQDVGRMAITNNVADLFVFKTAMLRKVVLTAPYMHNGWLRIFAEIVSFYNSGGGGGRY